MEGSAILPELAATLKPNNNIAAIWLTSSNELFEQRIYSASQYGTKSPCEKKMIDKFLERTCLYNERMISAVKQLGLPTIDVVNTSNIKELMGICLSILKKKNAKTFDMPNADQQLITAFGSQR
jgi:2-phosphoglycerate kinase